MDFDWEKPKDSLAKDIQLMAVVENDLNISNVSINKFRVKPDIDKH